MQTGALTSNSVALEQGGVRFVRRLISIYFILLILEGSLRKWFLPGLSGPLLIIRDPILIFAYFAAMSEKIFPDNAWLRWLLGISVLCMMAGLMAENAHPIVVAYGWRADFLHLPLIFLIPQVFDKRDVEKIGRWVLIVGAPMAVLMVLQFRAGAESWLNTTAGGDGFQLEVIEGKIRPAGTFSFSNGAGLFLSLICVFLAHGFHSPGVYPRWLLGMGTASLLSALAVSGSRGNIGASILVLAGLAGVWIVGRKVIGRSLLFFLVLAVAAVILSQASFFQEGVSVLGQRMEEAGEIEGGRPGFFSRLLHDHVDPFSIIFDLPLVGIGLGAGTNVGAMLMQGQRSFLLGEGEWWRVLYESGPIFGLMYLGWRVLLAFSLASRGVAAAKQDNYLPLLLFGAAGFSITSGQFSQPTALGFAVVGAGLCLASMNGRKAAPDETPHAAAAVQPSGKVRGRGRIAVELHER
jgi:hypothetical protein